MTTETTQTSQTMPPTYREQQHQRYLDALAMGQRHWAEDAIWRASSEANLLQPEEVNSDRLTTVRILSLLVALGWER